MIGRLLPVGIFLLLGVLLAVGLKIADQKTELPSPLIGKPMPAFMLPLLDREGELHFVIPRVRGEGRDPAVDRFIDLYHLRSTNERTEFTEPKRIFEGYCGAIQGVFQLESGRIIAPFADWIGGRPRTPPTGPSETTCVYSDDGGRTWNESPSRLTAPCYDGYNGGNYGACEPTLIELRDHLQAQGFAGEVFIYMNAPDCTCADPSCP